MKSLLSLLILVLAAAPLVAQSPQQKKVLVDGVFTNREGQVVTGLSLATYPVVEGKIDQRSRGNYTTDMNGRFRFAFTPGEYVVIANPDEIYQFRAQLKIVADGVNPEDVRFTVDTARLCCSDSKGEPYPKFVSAPKPAYPAAARAVRAQGQVIVNVVIKPDGTVAKAEAISGHPLLQPAAVAAARTTKFERSEEADREGRIAYLFDSGSPERLPGLTRYQNPFTVEVIAQVEYIYTTTNSSSH